MPPLAEGSFFFVRVGWDRGEDARRLPMVLAALDCRVAALLAMTMERKSRNAEEAGYR